ncbi:unnamed protein product [Nezara viridula]|uniref:Uncharacterized protein n=1 Tax=Nezara viridula TaxID=85310 RepID=A0A9P0H4J9_NEZVI|nr:unnamed protein product [Nezara viridula]
MGDRKVYAQKFDRMSALYEEVVERLRKAYEKSSQNYNLRGRNVDLNAGDFVWKRTQVLCDASKNVSNKFAPLYENARYEANKAIYFTF